MEQKTTFLIRKVIVAEIFGVINHVFRTRSVFTANIRPSVILDHSTKPIILAFEWTLEIMLDFSILNFQFWLSESFSNSKLLMVKNKNIKYMCELKVQTKNLGKEVFRLQTEIFCEILSFNLKSIFFYFPKMHWKKI